MADPSRLARRGGLLVVAGLGLDIYCIRLFQKNGTSVRVERPAEAIVTDGPFLHTLRWQVPVGEDEAGVRGLPNAGPVLVSGGLVFHGGTNDRHLWVYDATTGEVITNIELPAALHAGPITYRMRLGGKQYLVVAPGGHTGLDTKLGDYVIAYALPNDVPE